MSLLNSLHAPATAAAVSGSISGLYVKGVIPIKSVGSLKSTPRGTSRKVRERVKAPIKKPNSNTMLSRGASLAVVSADDNIVWRKDEDGEIDFL